MMINQTGTHVIHPICTSCRDCVDVCPTGSIFYGLTHFVIDRETCDDCRVCVKVCPVNAIHPFSATRSGEHIEHEED